MSGRDWELVARREPYWGVLSHDRYRSDRFDASAAEFWASGEEHVAAVLATLRARVCPDFRPTVAVDFGCGVGRLLEPLARRSTRVVGVDASPTMLALARENLTRREAAGWALVRSPAELREVAPEYDFLHSVLVFQHVRPSEGYRAFRELLAGLAPGGCGAVQFVVRPSLGPREVAREVRARWHLLGRAGAALHRRPAEAALIEVHGYDLGRLLLILAEAGIREVATSAAVGDRLDVTLYFRRP